MPRVWPSWDVAVPTAFGAEALVERSPVTAVPPQIEAMRRAWVLLGSALDARSPALCRALAERAQRELTADVAAAGGRTDGRADGGA